MPTIIRTYTESTLYKLASIKIGDFFEYNKKLFIKLSNNQSFSTPERKGKPLVDFCWNFSNNQSFYLNRLTNVYKCPNIEIKYSLE